MNFKHLIKTTLISALLFGASAFAEIKTVRIAHYTGVLCSAPVHTAWLKGFFDEEFKKIGQKTIIRSVSTGIKTPIPSIPFTKSPIRLQKTAMQARNSNKNAISAHSEVNTPRILHAIR